MIYFDNSATSGKKPDTIISSVNFALKNYSANPGRSGHNLSMKTADMVYRTREKISDFFTADGPFNVAFCLNCTTALNFVIKGILKSGDKVLVSDMEHNAVMRPLYAVGAQIIKIKTSFSDDRITVENFKEALTDDVKMVICTSASNVTGKIMPIGDIGKLCKEKGVLFCVDGAQGAGIIPINMKEMNIDFLCLAPHKGLYAPMGIGILIARSKIGKTLIEGGNGINSADIFQDAELPEGFESGTQNISGIFAVKKGIEFLERRGIDKMYGEEMKLISFIYNCLSTEEKVILYTPFPKVYGYAPLLSFNIKNRSSEETAELLNKKGIAVRAGLHCAPSAHEKIGTTDIGAVRISVSAFNNKYEANYLCDIIKNC